MLEVNQFLMNTLGLILVTALVIVIVLLAVIAKRFKRERFVYVMPSPGVEEQIAQFKQAAEHYADVSAVVTMIKQLDDLDEDTLALLKSYPETVRAAALLNYVNTLGADLQAAHKELSRVHAAYGDVNGPSIRTAQAKVDAIHAKLDAAVKLSGQQPGLRAV